MKVDHVAVCRAILTVGFAEIKDRAYFMSRTIVMDAGPLEGSPASLAGQLLVLARDAESFHSIKTRFRYQGAQRQIIELLVAELKAIVAKLTTIAKEVDAIEQRRHQRRPYFRLVQSGFVWLKVYAGGREVETNPTDQQDLWKSVPEVTKNAVRGLDDIVARCEQNLTALGIRRNSKNQERVLRIQTKKKRRIPALGAQS